MKNEYNVDLRKRAHFTMESIFGFIKKNKDGTYTVDKVIIPPDLIPTDSFNTFLGKIKIIKGAFACQGNLDIKQLDLSKLTRINGYFSCCYNPELREFDLRNLKKIGRDFYCSYNYALTQLNLEKLNNLKIYFMDNNPKLKLKNIIANDNVKQEIIKYLK